jgi:hypothetical protein
VQTSYRPLDRLGLVDAGVPTRRAAVVAPLAGSLLISGGVALWLFS